MSYAVKEIFYTLQGEGANAGSPAVLLRFSGCNLWSGREEDRPTAVCRFCDTDFRGTNGPNGGKYPTAEELADQVATVFPFDAETFEPWVICTGGEPLLQLDDPLLAALIERHFRVALETNGTIPFVNWLTVSPKAGHPIFGIVRAYNEEVHVGFIVSQLALHNRLRGGRHVPSICRLGIYTANPSATVRLLGESDSPRRGCLLGVASLSPTASQRGSGLWAVTASKEWNYPSILCSPARVLFHKRSLACARYGGDAHL